MRVGPGDDVATASLRGARVRKAVRLIDLSLNDARLSVGVLARDLGISAARLRQLYAAELGVGPKAYIIEHRLTRAAALLAASPVSVNEAMAVAGFNDASHFSREYRRRFGARPRIHGNNLNAIQKWDQTGLIFDFSKRLSFWPTLFACKHPRGASSLQKE
ncbi:MAG: helix-turn-helix transcriptional regulator [Terriglobia bacterium]